MAEFYVSVSSYDMASQIVSMLNKYNKWYKIFTTGSIMNTQARYFVELHNSVVVGCASCIQDYPTMSKIQHICVLPQYRGMGIAKKLTNLAINNANTDLVYMTIREDNQNSLWLSQSLGFIYAGKHWFRDHWTLTFGRKKNHDYGIKCC